jgi:hypothetical protein
MDAKLLNEMLHEIETMTDEAYWELFKEAQKLPDMPLPNTTENQNPLEIGRGFSTPVVLYDEDCVYLELLSRNNNHYPIEVARQALNEAVAIQKNEPIAAGHGEKEHSPDETAVLAAQLMKKHGPVAYERLEARRNSQK